MKSSHAEARRLLLATRSRDKIREIREILGRAKGIEIVTLDEAGLAATPEEDGIEIHETFIANALAKARYFESLSGLPTLADDSGLCVRALGGEPGVRSKRFASRTDLDGLALDLANNRALLDRLADVPVVERAAWYVCAAALVRDHRPDTIAIGTVSGSIVDTPRGDNGFGYDPHFLLPDTGGTLAELPGHAKNARSHRGRAFRALVSLLR